MLFKLSLRNAKRQTRDYLVYFITVTLAATMIYAFNGLVFSAELQSLSEAMETLPAIILMASIGVVGIMGWLVHYIVRFMLQRRSREFATYILMGLENKQVSKMFMTENLIFGGIALIVGTVAGNVLFQVLRAIILNLHGTEYYFRLDFSMGAVALTIFYFLLIYTYALQRCRRQILKTSIHSLLYLERRNEEEAVKKQQSRRRIFSLSVIGLFLGTVLLIVPQLLIAMIGAVLLIFSLYGFFINFAAGVPTFFEKRPTLKYRQTNLLVFRSLTGKMTTMGITMATIAVLLTATLISEGSGIVFSFLAERRSELASQFDLFVGSQEAEQPLDPYRDYMEKNLQIRQSHQYQIYDTGDRAVLDYIAEAGLDHWTSLDCDVMMKYSDYALLREMLGYAQVDLEPDHYLIHCLEHLAPSLAEYQEPLQKGGETLAKQQVCTENFTQYSWSGNGEGYILVVPDHWVTDQPTAQSNIAAMTDVPVSAEQFTALAEVRSDEVYGGSMDVILAPVGSKLEVAPIYTMIIFPLFYLALMLTMAAATILTVQMLSDGNRYRQQQQLLYQLGQSKTDMVKALNRQFFVYYALPLTPALVISITFLISLIGMMDAEIVSGPLQFAGIIGSIMGLFLFIYLLYVLAAYSSFRKAIVH